MKTDKLSPINEQLAQLCEFVAGQHPQPPPEYWHEQARRCRNSASWWRRWGQDIGGERMACSLEEKASVYDDVAKRAPLTREYWIEQARRAREGLDVDF